MGVCSSGSSGLVESALSSGPSHTWGVGGERDLRLAAPRLLPSGTRTECEPGTSARRRVRVVLDLGRPRGPAGLACRGAASPPLPLGDRPGRPRGLASSPCSSGVRHRGAGPGICPEAPPGKKPSEGLRFQAFLLEGSPCHPHFRILQGEKKKGSIVSSALHPSQGRASLGSPWCSVLHTGQLCLPAAPRLEPLQQPFLVFFFFFGDTV